MSRVTDPSPGTILNLGADWGLYDSNGTFSADTRYNLVTDDGANIFAQTSGPQQPDGPWAFLRIILQTGSEKYYWLNYVVAVGVLTRTADGIHIEAWQLTHSDNSTGAAEKREAGVKLKGKEKGEEKRDGKEEKAA
jgi:hypothetical protein